MPFPKQERITPAETPPYVGVNADKTAPLCESLIKRSYNDVIDLPSGSEPLGKSSGLKIYTLFPALLNSGEMMSFIFAVVTAKETSVGGTSSSPNVPLILSLPPIEAMPSASCASSAPRSAATGTPHLSGAVPGLPKYSWKER